MSRRKPSAPVRNEDKPARGRPSIWDNDRGDFLRARVPAYRAIGASHEKSGIFWPKLKTDYFSTFPYHFSNTKPTPPAHLSEEEKVEWLKNFMEELESKAWSQVKNFFVTARNRETTVDTSMWDCFFKAMKESMPKPVKSSAVHFYMKMDEYHDKVDEEFEREWAKRDESERVKKFRLAVRQDCAQKLFNAEPKQVREEVERLCAEDYAERLEEWEKEGDIMAVTPESIKGCRASLAYVMQPLIKKILQATGLTAGSFICAAPPPPDNPAAGYTILSVHEGNAIDSEGGQRFPDWAKGDYADVWVRFFLKFVALTTQASAEAHHAAEHAARAGQEGSENVDVVPNKEDARPLPNSASAPAARSTTTKKRRAKRTKNIDATELSGSETPSPPPSPAPETELPAVSRPPGVSAGATPDDDDDEEEDVPLAWLTGADNLRDKRGRALTNDLATHLKQASVPRRIEILNALSTIPNNPYEFSKACNIWRNRLVMDALEIGASVEDLFAGRSARAPTSENERGKRKRPEVEDEDENPRPRRRSTRHPRNNGSLNAEIVEEQGMDVDEVSLSNGEESAMLHSHGEDGEARANVRDESTGESATRESPGEVIVDSVRVVAQCEDLDDSLAIDDRRGAHSSAGVDLEVPGERGVLGYEDAVEKGDESRETRTPAVAREAVDSSASVDDSSQHVNQKHAGRRLDARADTRASQQQARASTQAPPSTARATRSHNRAAQQKPVNDKTMSKDDAPQPTSQHTPHSALRPAPPVSTSYEWESRESWPPWIIRAMENIEELPGATPRIRALWLEVVKKWFTLEASPAYSNVKGTKSLPADHRPACLHQWIKSARVATYDPFAKFDPDAPDYLEQREDTVEEYKEKVMLWWAKMNPPWRPRIDSLLSAPGEGSDWSALFCPGQNGLQTVLKALAWWYEWDTSEEGRILWEGFVGDVSFALDGLHNSYCMSLSS